MRTTIRNISCDTILTDVEKLLISLELEFDDFFVYKIIDSQLNNDDCTIELVVEEVLNKVMQKLCMDKNIDYKYTFLESSDFDSVIIEVTLINH